MQRFDHLHCRDCGGRSDSDLPSCEDCGSRFLVAHACSWCGLPDAECEASGCAPFPAPAATRLIATDAMRRALDARLVGAR